jgi:hypothetical protein
VYKRQYIYIINLHSEIVQNNQKKENSPREGTRKK